MILQEDTEVANARPIRLSMLVVAAGILFCSGAWAQGDYLSVHRFVPHTSTVPANRGERVAISLHERLTSETAEAIDTGEGPRGTVLFVHGGSSTSMADFDVPYKDYSWLRHLAEAGFDVFAMDQTGYGLSPRPMMDNPCNLPRQDQALLVPGFLPEPCDPEYSDPLTTLETDVDEVASVVSYILELRDVERISLIGWSAGGRKIAAYAAEYPDTVDKLVLYAPSVYTGELPPELPTPPDAPMTLRTRDSAIQAWSGRAACVGQTDDGIYEVIWQTVLGYDSLAVAWRPQGDVVRVPNAPISWNPDYASGIVAPTLMLVGEQDILVPYVRDLYEAAPATDKVLVNMDCASHYASWEAIHYRFMHEASESWLASGQLRGEREGIFTVGVDGLLVAE